MIKLEEAFNEAQEKGQIPLDEPFDALAIAFDGKKSWPYWLSVRASVKINECVFRNNKQEKRGWVALIGEDDDGNLHSLEYIRAGGAHSVRSHIRSQSGREY
jgi:hypothetical protein